MTMKNASLGDAKVDEYKYICIAELEEGGITTPTQAQIDFIEARLKQTANQAVFELKFWVNQMGGTASWA